MMGLLQKKYGRTKKDGTAFPTLTSMKTIVDNTGAPMFISATVIDITEMKRKDNEIKKLSLAIEQSPVAIVIADTEGFIQYVSPAFETITGYCPNEVIGKHTRILSSGKTKIEVYNEMWNTILSGSTWKGEWINKKKNGELYFESVSITPVKDEEGRVAYFLAVKENITQRKNAETALMKSEEQFRLLFTKSPVSILIHDKDSGEVIDCNPETLRIIGVSSLKDLKDYMIWSDSPSYLFKEYIDRVKSVEQNGPQQFEWQFKNAYGELIWVSENLTLLEIGGMLRVIATAIDITKQKQAEQDKIARQVAEEANRAKSAFLSNMSHEIRTPLNAIIGFAQILRRDKALSPKQSEQINTILRSGEHLMGLINDILDLSKIEAGRLTINEQEFNVHKLMADLKMMFGLSAKQKNLYFEFDVDESVPQFMYSDEAKLRQIFINLLGNAFKFISTGGIKVRVRAGQKTNERIPLLVEVNDTGHGISDTDIERIFDPFWQAAAGQAAGGTGLGLAICRDIIALMGGKLTVESQVGQGSSFKFYIMFKPSDKEKSNMIDKEHNVISLDRDSGPFRILIADDRVDNRNVLRELLQPMGFEVREAENGQEALTAFDEYQPHAILMDMRMPVMDGYEATKRIRATEQGKSVLLVGITASVFEEDMIKVTEAGADAVLNKPLRAEELFSLLSRIPGLNYIYENDMEEKTAEGESETSQQSLMGLPLELVEEMRSAVKQGNMVQFRKHAEKVEKVNPRFAKELLIMARKYDYDKLETLFRNKEEEING